MPKAIQSDRRVVRTSSVCARWVIIGRGGRLGGNDRSVIEGPFQDTRSCLRKHHFLPLTFFSLHRSAAKPGSEATTGPFHAFPMRSSVCVVLMIRTCRAARHPETAWDDKLWSC